MTRVLTRSSDPRVLCDVRFFDSELVVVLPAGQLSTRADPQAKSENTKKFTQDKKPMRLDNFLFFLNLLNFPNGSKFWILLLGFILSAFSPNVF